MNTPFKSFVLLILVLVVTFAVAAQGTLWPQIVEGDTVLEVVDDYDRGVSCYIHPTGSMSCVPVDHEIEDEELDS